ncbi:hypothetical protein K9B33_08400 [Sphingobium sp. 3R8]|uniref:DUF3303 family protein n=1 Tax=Sphingobium sp. 3R8 TaxID=2874921 RepID=UPI001CCF2CDF|nr:DUF3303 family protein [Sphingobium sp. 3R8]MBZ9647560.1 hypothetical protein [Sphingobium sp. 3R8]
MLFLVISEPRAERPSEARLARLAYWNWLDARLTDGVILHAYPKVGRGMAVIFDVSDHEALSAHLGAWAELVPAQFAVHALINADFIRRQLEEPS